MARVGRIAAGLVAIAVVAVSGGCAKNPGTAAVVDGKRISVSEIERASLEARPVVGQLSSAGFVLSLRMRSMAADRIAADNGMGDLQVAAEQVAGGDPEMPAEWRNNPSAFRMVVDDVKVVLLADRMGKENLNRALDAIPVEVNPRYGVNGLQAPNVSRSGVALGNGSLSKPSLTSGD